MIKIGDQERYLIIIAVLLTCVLILATAGVQISKENDNRAGDEPQAEGSGDVNDVISDHISTSGSSNEGSLNSSPVKNEDESNVSESGSAIESVSEQASSNNDKITLSVSSSLEYVSPEEMSSMSDVILIGTVKEVLPAEWNTGDGEQPTGDIYEVEWYDIYTDVVITVDEYLKNPLPEKEVIVRTIGGEKEIITIDVEDEPSFNAGEKVFLYLKNDTWEHTTKYGPEHFVVTGVSQGKFTLTEDGKATASGEPLTLDELMGTI